MSSFHYDFILSKRSSLAKVWLAAHWEKKLSKVQVFETNLQSSVHDILNPRTPIALRTSSHLLVGLVRIYSRKAKYLLTDCSEALVNIKVAFRPGVPAVNKSKGKKNAREALDCPFLITEKVDLLDQWIPELSSSEIDCSLNQSKVEEITIQEEPMKVTLLEDYLDDEGFGDMFESEQELENCETVLSRVYSFADSACGGDDGFICDTPSASEFSDPFTPLTPVKEVGSDNINQSNKITSGEIKTAVLESEDETPEVKDAHHEVPLLEVQLDKYTSGEDDDLFILDPVVKTPVKLPKPSRKSLKRKLLIDQEISIDREVIFEQINNTRELSREPVIAPRTKRRMKQSAHNDVHSLFLVSSLNEPLAPCLQSNFHCCSVHKNSTSSRPPIEEDALSCDSNDNEEDFNSIFIPLYDVDYSSDEDEPTNSFPGEVHCSTSSDDKGLLSPEQDEDISQDDFCKLVETTVLKSHSCPIDFHSIVCSGSSMRKKDVARRFLICLLMQRDSRVRLEQSSQFSDISLYPGAKYV